VNATKEDRSAYLRSVAAGQLSWADFAAGAASRLKVGPEFDPIGLVGLSIGILKKFSRREEEKPVRAEFQELIKRAATGTLETADDLTFLQLQMLSLRAQLARLVAETPEADVSLDQVLAGVRFVAVANDDNEMAFRAQISAIHGAGFGRVYVIIQNKEGLEKLLPDGSTVYTEEMKVPEGHMVPILDLAKRQGGAYVMDETGDFAPVTTTLKGELKNGGVEKLIFAQGNDLFLLKDFAAVERVVTAERVMKTTGAQMMMEMVENKIKQKGGGTKKSSVTGMSWMRDTIGIGQGLIPASLSRMFYVIDINALDRVSEDNVPQYVNLKELPDGSLGFAREMYSGDASSVIPAMTMQLPGHELVTYKLRPRTDEALQYIDGLLHSPGFAKALSQSTGLARSEARGVTLEKTQAMAKKLQEALSQELKGAVTVDADNENGVPTLLISAFGAVIAVTNALEITGSGDTIAIKHRDSVSNTEKEEPLLPMLKAIKEYKVTERMALKEFNVLRLLKGVENLVRRDRLGPDAAVIKATEASDMTDAAKAYIVVAAVTGKIASGELRSEQMAEVLKNIALVRQTPLAKWVPVVNKLLNIKDGAGLAVDLLEAGQGISQEELISYLAILADPNQRKALFWVIRGEAERASAEAERNRFILILQNAVQEHGLEFLDKENRRRFVIQVVTQNDLAGAVTNYATQAASQMGELANPTNFFVLSGTAELLSSINAETVRSSVIEREYVPASNLRGMANLVTAKLSQELVRASVLGQKSYLTINGRNRFTLKMNELQGLMSAIWQQIRSEIRIAVAA
jgi:hypothetical protein